MLDRPPSHPNLPSMSSLSKASTTGSPSATSPASTGGGTGQGQVPPPGGGGGGGGYLRHPISSSARAQHSLDTENPDATRMKEKLAHRTHVHTTEVRVARVLSMYALLHGLGGLCILAYPGYTLGLLHVYPGHGSDELIQWGRLLGAAFLFIGFILWQARSFTSVHDRLRILNGFLLFAVLTVLICTHTLLGSSGAGGGGGSAPVGWSVGKILYIVSNLLAVALCVQIIGSPFARRPKEKVGVLGVERLWSPENFSKTTKDSMISF